MPGLARDWPQNGRFWAVRSTASAVQGQRPRAGRSKLNIMFDHTLGLFKILDHTEPNSHALLSSIVRLHCIFLHHATTPHLPAPARTPPCTMPCTTLDLHHMDLILHHSRPAPHCTTLACTTFALHHTHHTRLHHVRPAPHPGPRSAPSHPPPSPYTTLHTRLHHIRPAPHLLCTTSHVSVPYSRDSEPTTEPVPPKQGLLDYRPVKLDSPSKPGYHSDCSEPMVQIVPKRCSWGCYISGNPEIEQSG